jgi:hypothetical protein
LARSRHVSPKTKGNLTAQSNILFLSKWKKVEKVASVEIDDAASRIANRPNNRYNQREVGHKIKTQ